MARGGGGVVGDQPDRGNAQSTTGARGREFFDDFRVGRKLPARPAEGVGVAFHNVRAHRGRRLGGSEAPAAAGLDNGQFGERTAEIRKRDGLDGHGVSGLTRSDIDCSI